eukprot:357435-Chlamydomonas_euryale.AAC.3
MLICAPFICGGSRATCCPVKVVIYVDWGGLASADGIETLTLPHDCVARLARHGHPSNVYMTSI